MPVFAFRALAATGRQERGVVDADSLRGAWEMLRRRGLYPTELAGARRASASRARVRAGEIALVLRQLATLVAAGVPIAEALETVADAGPPAALREALVTARGHVREGATLAQALAVFPAFFPPITCALVRVAEATATLPQVLERLALDGEAAATLRKRIRTACAYPAVLLATTGAALLFLLAKVVPQIADLFAESGTPLPFPTRALLALATSVRQTWFLFALAAAAGTVLVRRWFRSERGRAQCDRLALRVPVLGPLVRTAATARLLRTLSTVLGSGIPLETGLRLAADAVGNAVLGEATRAAADAVRRGEPLATAFARTGAFSPLLVRLAATGERGGMLADALGRAAAAADDDVATALDAATALLEPVLVLAVGGVVLVLVLAILVPVLTLKPAGVP